MSSAMEVSGGRTERRIDRERDVSVHGGVAHRVNLMGVVSRPCPWSCGEGLGEVIRWPG